MKQQRAYKRVIPMYPSIIMISIKDAELKEAKRKIIKIKAIGKS